MGRRVLIGYDERRTRSRTSKLTACFHALPSCICWPSRHVCLVADLLEWVRSVLNSGCNSHNTLTSRSYLEVGVDNPAATCYGPINMCRSTVRDPPEMILVTPICQLSVPFVWPNVSEANSAGTAPSSANCRTEYPKAAQKSKTVEATTSGTLGNLHPRRRHFCRFHVIF